MIYSRTCGRGCPFCRGLKVCADNNLEFLQPKIAAQWHPTQNGELKPDQVTSGSNRKAWWQCPNSESHVWLATISSRTQGRGCPQCSNQTSLPEIRLYSEISGIIGQVSHKEKVHGVEIDVFLEKYQIGTEYDGAYYHREQKENDLKKNKFFEKFSIPIVRVREAPLDKLSDLDVVTKKGKFTKGDVNSLLGNIAHMLDQSDRQKIAAYLAKKKFQSDQQFKYNASFLPGPIPSKSLAFLRPDIAAQWHPTKIRSLKPDQVTLGSERNFWWQCPESEIHVWEAMVYSRTKYGGCPFCSGREACADNNLALLRPDLV